MKRNRRPSIALLKHGREQVLPGVLLHVIEASRPVDAAIHVRIRRAAVNDVKNFFSLISHVEHVRIADLPQIMRLPAGSRVKSRAVEKQAPGGSRNPALHVRRKYFAIDNPRSELLQE